MKLFSKVNIMRTPFLLAAGLLCGAAVIIACTGQDAMIRVNDSNFCANIPEGQYSIICEITTRMGTTPEAVRIITKVANMVGVDQWYSANAADKFIADSQVRISEFKASGGASWAEFGAYVIGQYDLLPPKVRAAIVIARDLFEFNPPNLRERMLSEWDWVRIEGNLADQRAILAPFKK